MTLRKQNSPLLFLFFFNEQTSVSLPSPPPSCLLAELDVWTVMFATVWPKCSELCSTKQQWTWQRKASACFWDRNNKDFTLFFWCLFVLICCANSFGFGYKPLRYFWLLAFLNWIYAKYYTRTIQFSVAVMKLFSGSKSRPNTLKLALLPRLMVR